MATMTIRTTVAFDPATAARLERLAKRWGVSKSETLRRALETVENQTRSTGTMDPLADDEIAAMTPRQAFEWLRANPQSPPAWGNDGRKEILAMREMDAQIEEHRESQHATLSNPVNPPGA